MSRTHWPATVLEPIFAEAEQTGSTQRWFKTLTDAERFRFACYNLRRRKNLNQRLSFFLDGEDFSILIRLNPPTEINSNGPMQQKAPQ